MKQFRRIAAVFAVAFAVLGGVVPAGAEVLTPSAPTGLVAAPEDGAIALAWQPPSDATLITGYRIYRGTSAGSLAGFATTQAVAYRDADLANGDRYHYAVSALTGPVEGERSIVVAETAGRPTPVEKLAATVTVRGDVMTVTLTWQPPRSFGGSLVGYRVIEWTGGTPTELAFLSPDSLAFTHRTRADYVVYVVIAVGEFGESDISQVAAQVECTQWC